MRHLYGLMAAVSFLSRLPVPGLDRVDLAAVLPASMRWFPVVGGLLGMLACLPLLPVVNLNPALRGLVYTLLLLWLTRGLHWDGFADLCDAAGSGATGERFGSILKDSRLGAFGGMGLVAAMGGQAVLAQTAPLEALILAPFVGRSLVMPLMVLNLSRPESTLCRLMLPGASKMWGVVHGVLAFGLMVFLFGWERGIVLVVFAGLIVWRLTALARRTGGMNGDYHGTAIILGEIAVLFAVMG